jgi:transcriptional regulator with XRE-family HTH domain
MDKGLRTLDDRIKELKNDAEYESFGIVMNFFEDILEHLDKKEIKTKNKYLSERLNCDPAYVSRLLNSSPNISIKKMFEIALAADLRLKIQLIDESSFQNTKIFSSLENYQMKLESADNFETDLQHGYQMVISNQEPSYETVIIDFKTHKGMIILAAVCKKSR